MLGTKQALRIGALFNLAPAYVYCLVKTGPRNKHYIDIRRRLRG